MRLVGLFKNFINSNNIMGLEYTIANNNNDIMWLVYKIAINNNNIAWLVNALAMSLISS